METEQLCSQTFLPPTAMLGEMYRFQFTPFFGLIQSSTKRKTCYSFWEKGEVLFFLEQSPGILKGIIVFSAQ